MYMSTAVPADAQCYVTQCYYYTPVSYPEQEGCITSAYFQRYPLHLENVKKLYLIAQDYKAADLCITR